MELQQGDVITTRREPARWRGRPTHGTVRARGSRDRYSRHRCLLERQVLTKETRTHSRDRYSQKRHVLTRETGTRSIDRYSLNRQVLA